MKRIATTLVIATLAGAVTAAMAADSPFPSSADDTYSQTDVFPYMPTYEQEHHADASRQAAMAWPSGGRPDSYNATSVFPDMATYAQEHTNDPAYASATPTFPYSVPDSESMADEGLVAGIAGKPTDDNDDSVAATH